MKPYCVELDNGIRSTVVLLADNRADAWSNALAIAADLGDDVRVMGVEETTCLIGS